MKHAILVRDGRQILGIASNLKKVLEMIDATGKQSYATIALTVSFFKPYDIGSGLFNKIYYENLIIEKYEVNRFPGS